MLGAPDIELFSTCPPAPPVVDRTYLDQVAEVARWSEQAGCRGILVYSDNSQVDPWLIAQAVIASTHSLSPLVAIQPVYMHPYTVAKTVASIAALHGRRVYLNMVAGGFKNDLTALGDATPHDSRYARLTEYTDIIQRLLRGEPVSSMGDFYKIENLKLAPRCPTELQPGVFMSGSSDAGMAAARQVGATAIEYPKPVGEYAAVPTTHADSGIRIGVISRGQSGEAWAAAHRRFPEDRKGQLTHQLAMKVSDSVWHQQLSGLAEQEGDNPYWLVPFQNYKTMCPYLVGSYDEVGRELASYIACGYRTFITDVPQQPDELGHIGRAFHNALDSQRWQDSSRIG